MKKFILTVCTVAVLGTAFFLMAFNAPAEKNDPYILVEIYEIPSYPDRGVHIHYGGNKREVIKFPGMDVEHHDDAGDITLAAINKLVEQGYHIESSSSGLSQAGMITKIWLRKK